MSVERTPPLLTPRLMVHLLSQLEERRDVLREKMSEADDALCNTAGVGFLLNAFKEGRHGLEKGATAEEAGYQHLFNEVAGVMEQAGLAFGQVWDEWENFRVAFELTPAAPPALEGMEQAEAVLGVPPPRELLEGETEAGRALREPAEEIEAAMGALGLVASRLDELTTDGGIGRTVDAWEDEEEDAQERYDAALVQVDEAIEVCEEAAELLVRLKAARARALKTLPDPPDVLACKNSEERKRFAESAALGWRIRALVEAEEAEKERAARRAQEEAEMEAMRAEEPRVHPDCEDADIVLLNPIEDVAEAGAQRLARCLRALSKPAFQVACRPDDQGPRLRLAVEIGRVEEVWDDLRSKVVGLLLTARGAAADPRDALGGGDADSMDRTVKESENLQMPRRGVA